MNSISVGDRLFETEKPCGGVTTNSIKDGDQVALAVTQEWRDPILGHGKKIYLCIHRNVYTKHHSQDGPLKEIFTKALCE